MFGPWFSTSEPRLKLHISVLSPQMKKQRIIGMSADVVMLMFIVGVAAITEVEVSCHVSCLLTSALTFYGRCNHFKSCLHHTM